MRNTNTTTPFHSGCVFFPFICKLGQKCSDCGVLCLFFPNTTLKRDRSPTTTAVGHAERLFSEKKNRRNSGGMNIKNGGETAELGGARMRGEEAEEEEAKEVCG